MRADKTRQHRGGPEVPVLSKSSHPSPEPISTRTFRFPRGARNSGFNMKLLILKALYGWAGFPHKPWLKSRRSLFCDLQQVTFLPRASVSFSTQGGDEIPRHPRSLLHGDSVPAEDGPSGESGSPDQEVGPGGFRACFGKRTRAGEWAGTEPLRRTSWGPSCS